MIFHEFDFLIENYKSILPVCYVLAGGSEQKPIHAMNQASTLFACGFGMAG
jgi:hypothetical protein